MSWGLRPEGRMEVTQGQVGRRLGMQVGDFSVSQENKLLSKYYQESLGLNSSMQDRTNVSFLYLSLQD